jgi:hypothetical protein
MIDRKKCLLFSRYTQFKDRVADRQAGVPLMNSRSSLLEQLKIWTSLLAFLVF